MATSSTHSSSNFALELGGQSAGWLRSVEPSPLNLVPGSRPRQPRRLQIGEFWASYALSEADAVLDWMQSVLDRREAQPQSGAVVYANTAFKPVRRVDFSGALITEIRFPTLDGASKLPFEVQFKWLPGTVSFSKPVHAAALPAAGKRKAWILSNFRFLGLPFDGSSVTRVQLPALAATVLPGAGRKPPRHDSIQWGELVVEVSTRGEDALLEWVNKIIDDGKLVDAEFLDLSVEMLDPSLKKTLATLALGRCGLLRVAHARNTAGDTQLRTITLTFSVERLGLEVKATKG